MSACISRNYRKLSRQSKISALDASTSVDLTLYKSTHVIPVCIHKKSALIFTKSTSLLLTIPWIFLPPSYIFQVFYAQDMDGPEAGETFADYNREPTTSSSAVVDDVMTESSDESGTYSK